MNKSQVMKKSDTSGKQRKPQISVRHQHVAKFLNSLASVIEKVNNPLKTAWLTMVFLGLSYV